MLRPSTTLCCHRVLETARVQVSARCSDDSSPQLDFAYDLFGGFSRYICLFGITRPIGHGSFYLRPNLRSICYPMLFAQCLKLGSAGIPTLTHDEHALLAPRTIGKD